ncbi:MAG: FKBP-type peptidyl-prolyl cis-trans isomerase [Prevotellaceae bacterium]|jgi:FKBP-type peptidyl-prolyl cis-trans isomerase|nr:FKBP-type peptidyl-prolyl cis-trans isomerase [Prevotellaceae bacterium]
MAYSRKYFAPLALVVMAALTFVRCAKEPSESEQKNELQLIKSTVKVHFPNAQPIEFNDSSMWLISHHENTSGHIAKPQDESYVEFSYHGQLLPVSRSVVYQTTDSLKAHLLGAFAATTHYAPMFSYYHKDYMQVALHRALGMMSVGDSLTVLSASWHAFGSAGTTGVSANTPVIFTVKLSEIVANADSALARERRMVEKYVNDYNSNSSNSAKFVPAVDSTGTEQAGIYVCYVDTVPRNDTVLCAQTGETLSLKYSGYYLRDGFLLDSNIGKDATGAGWSVDTTSTTSTYQTYYSHTFSKAPLSSTSIKAFDVALLNVAVGSKVEVVFTSEYGYGAAGTTTNASRPIYPYTPLRFYISFESIQ